MRKQKKSKHVHQKNEHLLGTNLIVLGIVLLGFWGLHKFFYIRSLTLSLQHTLQLSSNASPVSHPSSIRIGSLINAPIAPAGYVNGSWLISEKAANHVTKSASPGEKGNIIIYAHNRAALFGSLNQVQKGEEIIIQTKEGKEHSYKVVEIVTVAPTNTTLLLPTQFEMLTLYTCTGFLDSMRLVVRATPITKDR